jgi:hypothetical protein
LAHPSVNCFVYLSSGEKWSFPQTWLDSYGVCLLLKRNAPRNMNVFHVMFNVFELLPMVLHWESYMSSESFAVAWPVLLAIKNCSLLRFESLTSESVWALAAMLLWVGKILQLLLKLWSLQNII